MTDPVDGGVNVHEALSGKRLRKLFEKERPDAGCLPTMGGPNGTELALDLERPTGVLAKYNCFEYDAARQLTRSDKAGRPQSASDKAMKAIGPS